MRKRSEGEDRLNLDKMRAMMNQQNQDEKETTKRKISKIKS